MILHITPRGEWTRAVAAGSYRPASLQREGFIHLSTAEQVIGVANRFYAGLPDLVLLVIDPARLTAELRWEAPIDPVGPGPKDAGGPRGDRGLFPHLYGPLNLDAVAQVLDFSPASDGTFSLPQPLRPGSR